MSVGESGKADNKRTNNDREDWKKTAKGTPVEGGVSPDTTFHHLIPYNNIWTTWSKLVGSADPIQNKPGDWRQTDAGSALACLTTWLELLGYPDPQELAMWVAAAHSDRKIPVIEERAKPLSRDVCNSLSANLLWTGWNIVEGPLRTIRADDPEEKFDDFEVPA
jgi:hypothetical protein